MSARMVIFYRIMSALTERSPVEFIFGVLAGFSGKSPGVLTDKIYSNCFGNVYNEQMDTAVLGDRPLEVSPRPLVCNC